MLFLRTVAAAWLFSIGGCTSFATVRSAEVRPGPAVTLQAAVAPTVGEAAGWFWAADCVSGCNAPVFGGDLALSYGFRLGDRPQALALGLGTSGMYPFFEGYLQLTGGPRPLGIGARIATPGLTWKEHQVYVRHDRARGDARRLLLNTGLFIHDGRAPNGSSPGRFVALVQAVGWQTRGERRTWTPAVALGLGRTNRSHPIDGEVIEGAVFGAVSLGITFERRSATSP